jgi:hypothetical protein
LCYMHTTSSFRAGCRLRWRRKWQGRPESDGGHGPGFLRGQVLVTWAARISDVMRNMAFLVRRLRGWVARQRPWTVARPSPFPVSPLLGSTHTHSAMSGWLDYVLVSLWPALNFYSHLLISEINYRSAQTFSRIGISVFRCMC